MRDSDDLSELIYLIYETVGKSHEAWQRLLDELFQHVRTHMGSVMQFANGEMRPVLVGSSERAQQDYLDYFVQIDPWVTISAQYQVNDVAIEVSQELVPDSVLHRTEFYQDFARKVGYGYGFGIAFDDGEGSKTIISAVRESCQFSAEEINWLRRLTPHLQQALRLGRAFEEARLERKSLLESIDQLQRGIILTDESGRIVVLNKPAERMTSSKDGLAIFDGRLRTLDPRASERIRAYASGVVNAQSGGGTVLVRRPSGKKPWVIAVTRYGNSAQRLSCLMITDPEMALQPDSEVVAELYGFTPAEARLSLFLLNGERLESAAQKLGITINTARTHMKRMLSKAGVRSQSELIALLSRIPAKPTIDQRGGRN